VVYTLPVFSGECGTKEEGLSPESTRAGNVGNLPVSTIPAFTSDDLALILGTCFPDPAFLAEAETGAIVAFNQKFLSLVGIGIEQAESMELSSHLVIVPNDRGIFTTWQRTLGEGEEGNFDLRIQKTDGKACPVNITLQKMRWKRKHYLVAYVREISAIEEKEAKLKGQIEQQKARAFEAIKSSLRMYQFNEKIKRTPLLAKRLLNLENEDQLFQEAAKVLTSEEGLNYREVNFLLLEGDHLRLVFSTQGVKEQTFPLADGNRFSQFIRRGFRPGDSPTPSILLPLQSRGQLVGICEVVPYPKEKLFFDESSMVSEWQNDVLQDIGGIIAVLIDNLRLNREIKRQSITDPLTQAYNRHYFVGRLTSEVHRATRYSRPVSTIFVDVDQFKPINDRYGHLQGDYVLRELGKLLVQSLRDVDIVCRYGGDEFVILLPETDAAMARCTAEKILEAVRSHAFHNLDKPEECLAVTVSVGVSTLGSGATEDDLIRSADSALYKAKTSGRDQVAVSWLTGDGKGEAGGLPSSAARARVKPVPG
jgi:diguanylate cyclase (GGDEF)-like protein/PAS domain S-box-containing protein